MIPRHVAITLAAVIVAILAWLLSLQYTDSTVVHAAILIGIGVLAPSLYFTVTGSGSD